jgi:hypothetical protein
MVSQALPGGGNGAWVFSRYNAEGDIAFTVTQQVPLSYNQFIIYYHPNIIDGTSIKSGDVVVLDVDGKTDVKAG